MAVSKAKKTTKEVGEDFVPRKRPSVFSKTNADGSVSIMHLEQDEYYFSLDGISAEVWNLLDSKTSVKNIIKKLRMKRPELPARLNEDVISLMQSLFIEDLLY